MTSFGKRTRSNACPGLIVSFCHFRWEQATLVAAEEAAAAPEAVRRQLEQQLAVCQAALTKAEEEVNAMRTSEQTQQMALLDELNSVQTENEALRAQLRAAKAGK